jgi:hypothetical protein
MELFEPLYGRPADSSPRITETQGDVEREVAASTQAVQR